MRKLRVSLGTPDTVIQRIIYLVGCDNFVVQLLSRVRLFPIPWIIAYQASLSITVSQTLLKLMSIESVMPPNHLILCHPFLFSPSIFASIGVFSSESALRIRWPNYWSFSSASVLPVNIRGWFPLGWTGWTSFYPRDSLQHHSLKASILRHSAFFIIKCILSEIG